MRLPAALIIASILSVSAGAEPSAVQDARLVPAVVPGSNGQVKGFRFVDVDAGSIYAKNGLKKNDIVKSVNGHKIDGPEKAMELHDSLKKNKTTKVVIERDGKDHEMTLKGSAN